MSLDERSKGGNMPIKPSAQHILDHLPCSAGATMPRTLLTDTGRLIADALMILFVAGVISWALAGFFG